MSRRSNHKRRKHRRERKLALEKAKADFHQKYPERGYYLPLFMINAYAQMYGEEYAQQRFNENRNPLDFDNILMKKKCELYDHYFSHNHWQKGLDSLKTPGWTANPSRRYLSMQKLESQTLIDTLDSE